MIKDERAKSEDIYNPVKSHEYESSREAELLY